MCGHGADLIERSICPAPDVIVSTQVILLGCVALQPDAGAAAVSLAPPSMALLFVGLTMFLGLVATKIEVNWGYPPDAAMRCYECWRCDWSHETVGTSIILPARR